MSSDYNFIVSGGADETAKVWETTSGKLLHSLEGHADWVRDGGGEVGVSAESN